MFSKKVKVMGVFVISAVIVSCASHQKNTASTLLNKFSQCRSISGLKLPHAVVTRAEPILEGEYLAPDGITYSVPAFCRVSGVAVPTEDSHIKFEIWMPINSWTGRFYHQGGGGFSGNIDQWSPSLVDFIKKGSVVTITDTGHEGKNTDGSWALRQPEKIIDYGYRSLKETTDNAKRVVKEFYGKKPDYSYFSGCSNGGRQAMMAAHRYPEDWDGMLIGAPANDFIRLVTTHAWRYHALSGQSKSAIPISKLPAIQKAALASCEGEAHVNQEVAADPRFCRLDTDDLNCNEKESDSCLTVAQADALEKIYEGPRNPRTGKKLYPGFESTVENQGEWAKYIIGTAENVRSQYAMADGLFSNMVFDNPEWDIHSLDYDKDIDFASSKDIAGERLSDVLSIVSPDFKKMEAKGAKVIMYHGWGDAAISAKGVIQDYEGVVKKMGGIAKTQNFYRLFMVPGMLHCGRGPGANAFGQFPISPGLKKDAKHDVHLALEAWVENDRVPESVIATKYIDDNPEKGVAFTRPICPYPKVPVYKGEGDDSQAASFHCLNGASPE